MEAGTGRRRAGEPGRRWTIPRGDLGSGGGVLLRLVHPLLPSFSRCRATAEGIECDPAVPAPGPLPPGEAGARPELFLARLTALLAFLRWAGLGVGPRDALRVGTRPSSRSRPALAGPPTPLWRSTGSGVVVAAAALRILGVRLSEADEADGLREEVVSALERTPAGRLTRAARRAVQAEETAEGPAGLLADLLGTEGNVSELVGGDLLGLVAPADADALEAGRSGEVVAAWGRSASWLVRGAVRGAVPTLPFVEVEGGNGLEEGAALRKLSAALPGGHRGPPFAGFTPGVPTGNGPPENPTAVVALGADRWDSLSRRAWEAPGKEWGTLVRFETREGPPPPWERRAALRPRLDLAEISSLVWLPWTSPAGAAEAYRSLVREASGDPDRLLGAVRMAASEFRFSPLGGRHLKSGRAPRRPGPVLSAAALLAPGFAAGEVALAAGVEEFEAASSLESAVDAGVLDLLGERSFRFADDSVRRRLVAAIPAAGRDHVLARLARGGLAPLRLAASRLARGTQEDLDEAASLLSTLVAAGDAEEAGLLLERAPEGSPDLGRPLAAARAWLAAGNVEAARAAARRVTEPDFEGLPHEERLRSAFVLARLGEAQRALPLAVGPEGSDQALLAELLLSARRPAEAARSAEEALAAATHDAGRARALILLAEASSRQGDLALAGRRLAEAASVLGPTLSAGESAATARAAGFVASDLGRPAEAALFFRLARDSSADPEGRTEASLDLAVALFHSGDLRGASRELENVLAAFAAQGDEARYAAALGNRADLRLVAADLDGARSDLDRVLAFDRRPGRERSLLFSLPSRQELALLEGDLAQARDLFDEAERASSAWPAHDAWRHSLLLEARRRLMDGDPEAAGEALRRAASLPDNRMCDEALRLRLAFSAALDSGRERPLVPPPEQLGPLEVQLALAELRLSGGASPGPGPLGALEASLDTPRGAVDAASRVFEWSLRFPNLLDSPAAAPLREIGAAAAARAGLATLAARLRRHPSGTRVADRLPVPAGPRSCATIVAEDASTRAALALAARAAQARLPVLLLGETGTGKEVLAREVHRLSGRMGPFVAVNLAALPEALAEAELFGCARGAYTGAWRERRGLVEESGGGTLFLDEVGELPAALQAKLLRVLQERSVRRLGESRERAVDLHLLSATNRDLAALVSSGRFREDLYWRLQGFEIRLAPLRERPRDVAALVERILDGEAVLSREARERLLAWNWPGNVRELRSALESARALASPGRMIQLEHLPAPIRGAGKERASPPDGEVGRYQEALDDARRAVILRALAEAGGNRTHAADWLGLSRQSLLYEVRRLRLAAGRA